MIKSCSLLYVTPNSGLRKGCLLSKRIYTRSYAEYAKKFLGIEGISNTDKVEYAITRIDIETHSETDPKAIFAVYPSGKGYGNYLKLSADGLILPLTQTIDSRTLANSQDFNSSDEVVFKDLSVNPFIAEETTTFYGRTLRDSVYVRGSHSAIDDRRTQP